MKLYTTDNTELMNVSRITAESNRLVISGTIMGAMPIQAVLSGREMRSALALLSFRTVAAAIRIFFSKS